MEPVLHVRAFQDNYIWLLRTRTPNRVAVVDPGDAAPVIAALERLQLTPVAILCTHHHPDHVGGVPALLARYPVPVYGPARETIPAMTHALQEGDHIDVDGIRLQVLDIPGHTAGHIALHGDGLLFCGDTLFSAGCGRLFEGTAEQLYASLGKLTALPKDTSVYCGHEYTLANLAFAIAVEPDNTDIHQHKRQVETWCASKQPSLPSTLGLELHINPFLRCHLPQIQHAAEAHAQQTFTSAVQVFAALRRWKDSFKG